MRKLTDLEKQVNENLVEILKDTLKDSKKIIQRMQYTIVFLILMLVGVSIYYEYNFKAFLSQYDIENTVTQEFKTDGETNGNLTIHDINNNISSKK